VAPSADANHQSTTTVVGAADGHNEFTRGGLDEPVLSETKVRESLQPLIAIRFICRVGPLWAHTEMVPIEFPIASCVGGAREFLAQVPKLHCFELQLTQGETLKEEDPLQAGDITVEPVVYGQYDRNCFPVSVYLGISRVTVRRFS
jgi:hypothetical protein